MRFLATSSVHRCAADYIRGRSERCFCWPCDLFSIVSVGWCVIVYSKMASPSSRWTRVKRFLKQLPHNMWAAMITCRAFQVAENVETLCLNEGATLLLIFCSLVMADFFASCKPGNQRHARQAQRPSGVATADAGSSIVSTFRTVGGCKAWP